MLFPHPEGVVEIGLPVPSPLIPVRPPGDSCGKAHSVSGFSNAGKKIELIHVPMIRPWREGCPAPPFPMRQGGGWTIARWRRWLIGFRASYLFLRDQISERLADKGEERQVSCLPMFARLPSGR